MRSATSASFELASGPLSKRQRDHLCSALTEYFDGDFLVDIELLLKQPGQVGHHRQFMPVGGNNYIAKPNARAVRRFAGPPVRRFAGPPTMVS